MHNILYVISVDDCFLAENRQEMEAQIYSEMTVSLSPFISVLSSKAYANEVNTILEMQEIGIDASILIQSLIEKLEINDIKKCYELRPKSNTLYNEEKNAIIAFLEEMKSNGIIKKYITFSSVSEANLFDVKIAGMTDGAVLWLVDRNFWRVGESADAGLLLAENLAKRTDGVDRYIYVLSAVNEDSNGSEDEIELEFDKVLAEKCSAEIHSFIYYINKQRIISNKKDKIARSLAQGFKRKACYELFQILSDCLSDGLSDATTKIQNVRQKTLNYLFANRVKEKGESYIDFARRFVQIFHNDGYDNAVSQKYDKIAEKAKYIEKLCCVIPENAGNKKELTNIIKEYRELEMYNYHINAQHSEVTTGDIYDINGKIYLLVSQSCDTYLRVEGVRKLTEATLLEISDDGIERKYSYSLSCFPTMKKPSVVFQSLKRYPFEILDLCTFNASGQATIHLKDVAKYEKELELYTINYQKRFLKVLEKLNEIFKNSIILKRFWEEPSKQLAEDAYKAYIMLNDVNAELKNYESFDEVISFPVKRICQLTELITIDIIKEYGLMLSRIGHPFDFLEDSNSEIE